MNILGFKSVPIELNLENIFLYFLQKKLHYSIQNEERNQESAISLQFLLLY